VDRGVDRLARGEGEVVEVGQDGLVEFLAG
jgi:hypothetical protein